MNVPVSITSITYAKQQAKHHLRMLLNGEHLIVRFLIFLQMVNGFM